MGAPGQYNEEQDRSIFIPTEKQAIAAIAMICERGPIGRAELVVDWNDFQRLYGGYVPGQVAQHCAKIALDAGCQLYVSRVVHFTDVEDLTTKTSAAALVQVVDRSATPAAGQATGSGAAPFRLKAGGTIIVSIDGAADETVTFRATRAIVTGVGATYAAVTAGHQLVLLVNGVQRAVAFAGTEATQQAFMDAINAAIPGIAAVNSAGQLRLETDRMGSSAALAVDAATAADVLASLGLTAGAGPNAGPNDVADIDAVTAEEYAAVVGAVIAPATAGVTGSGAPYIRSGTTGVGSTVQVQATSTLATALGFDNVSHGGVATTGQPTLRFRKRWDGTWGNGLRVDISDDASDPANRFTVREMTAAGVIVNTFAGLSMDPEDPRYVVKVLRDESSETDADDLGTATAAPGNRPAIGTYAFAGGLDGTAGLLPLDWIGSENTLTGLHAFDTQKGFRLLAMPGVEDTEILTDAIAYCEARTDIALIWHTPLTADPRAAMKYRQGTAPYSYTAIDSSYGGLYFGWYEILHPKTRAAMYIPPLGDVLAAFARANKELGPWLAAAGPQRGKLSIAFRKFKWDLSPGQMDALYDAGINCCYKNANFGPVIWGQKTLQRLDSALQRLNVRLLSCFIEEQVATYLEPKLFEPNDEILWDQLKNPTDTFMQGIKDKRALEGFKVICDGSNNTPTERQRRRTHVDVYFTAVETSEEQHITRIVMPPGTNFGA
jgi:hypothetical protein